MIFLSQPRVQVIGMDPAHMTQTHACQVCRKEVPSSTDNGVVWVEVHVRGTELVPLTYSCKKHRPKGGALMRPFLALIVLLVATLGCGTETKHSLAPAEAEAFVMPPGSFYAWVEDDNGNKVFAIVEWDHKSGPNQVRILYICDYPMDFYGPLMSGHCRVDGSDCHGYEIGPTGTYAAPRKPGDPVGAHIGTQGTLIEVFKGEVRAADADGIVVR